MVNFRDLLDERRYAIQELGFIMFGKDIQVNTMFSAREERLAVVAPNDPTVRIIKEQGEKIYLSMSFLTTSITNGLGLIVYKFPRGICKTKLMALGTATTILDPRSTRRVSQLGSLSLIEPLPSSNKPFTLSSGMKVAS